MSGVPFVLASGSPRRRELLSRLLGEHGFRWSAAGFDEDDGDGDAPRDVVLRLAHGKRTAWVREHARGPRSEAFVLAADTGVALDGRILGKPRDADDAMRMIRSLSGRRHEVVTGLSLAFVRGGEEIAAIEDAVTTLVTFAPLPEPLVQWYAATGEPLDKAGAYGIQGHGAVLVERIEGCYYNVMGLPLRRLYEMLLEIQRQPGVPRIDSPLFPPRAGDGNGRGEGRGNGERASDDPRAAGGRPAG